MRGAPGLPVHFCGDKVEMPCAKAAYIVIL